MSELIVIRCSPETKAKWAELKVLTKSKTNEVLLRLLMGYYEGAI